MLWAAGGCSFSRTNPSCETTDECRKHFGPGYVCAEEGLCEIAPIEPSCLNHYPSDLLLAPENYRDHIILGSLMRSTGKEGARQDSAFLAVDAFNRFAERNETKYPELARLRFGLVQCDHQGSVSEAARLAEYLVDTLRTPAIFGPSSSSAIIKAFEEVNIDESGSELRRALFISPSATSAALTEEEKLRPGLLWRTAPTDDGQGLLMGKFAQDYGSPIVVFHEETAYGQGLFSALKDKAGSLCKDCAFSFDGSSSDVNSLASALGSYAARDRLDESSLVFFIGAQEAHLSEMVERMDDPEFAGKTIFFSDAAASSDTVKLVANENRSRVIGTRAKAKYDGESYGVFSSIYEARYDESPLNHSFTTNAYDATWMLLLGALYAQTRGKEISPVTIAEGMTKLSDRDWKNRSERDCLGDYKDGDCLPISLDAENIPAMLSAFKRFARLDVTGASGTLDYDEDTEELRSSEDSFELWHIDPPTTEGGSVTIRAGAPDSGTDE